MGQFIMEETTDEDGWWRFLALCSKLKTPEEFNEFFDLFLTIEEKKDIANRGLIVRGLLRGERTQREMADELHVSIAKITRGSNSLKTIDETLRNFLVKNIK